MPTVGKILKTDSQKGKTYTILPKMYLLLLEKLSTVFSNVDNLVQSQAM